MLVLLDVRRSIAHAFWRRFRGSEFERERQRVPAGHRVVRRHGFDDEHRAHGEPVREKHSRVETSLRARAVGANVYGILSRTRETSRRDRSEDVRRVLVLALHRTKGDVRRWGADSVRGVLPRWVGTRHVRGYGV